MTFESAADSRTKLQTDIWESLTHLLADEITPYAKVYVQDAFRKACITVCTTVSKGSYMESYWVSSMQGLHSEETFVVVNCGTSRRGQVGGYKSQNKLAHTLRLTSADFEVFEALTFRRRLIN